MRDSNGGVMLTEGDFYKLMAKAKHVEVLRLKAEKDILAAQTEQARLFDALAVKYGFDPKASYGVDEATCRLVPQGDQVDPT